MRRLTALCLVVAVASTAFGSLYSWKPNNRPPVTLKEAIVIAEKMLGEDAKERYCVAVTLYGSRENDGKKCGWNLYYAAKDGSIRHVFIDESGQGSAGAKTGAVDWFKKQGRRTGLRDIATRLNEALAENGYEERAKISDGKLSLRINTRSYQVYSKTDNGAYSNKLTEVIGPAHDGVLIEAKVISSEQYDPGREFSTNAPYWLGSSRGYLLTKKGMIVAADIKYGQGFVGTFGAERTTLHKLLQAFGEPRPTLF